MIRPIKYNIDKVLFLQELDKNLFPLNIEIKGKNCNQIKGYEKLKGPGIYIIFEKKGSLIYIGTWNISNETVHEQRWWKHISTFTFRGIDIAKQTKSEKILKCNIEQQLNDLFKKCNRVNPPKENLRAALKKFIKSGKQKKKFYRKSVALQLSYKRAAYANYHWEKFNNEKTIQNISNHFFFYYYQMSDLLEIKNEKKRNEILEKFEEKLVNKFSPIVNDRSKNKMEFINDQVNINDITKVLNEEVKIYT